MIAGPDVDAATGYRLDLPAPRPHGLAAARLLLLDAHPAATTSTVLADAVARVGEAAARAGAEVARQSELLPDLAAAHAAYTEMLGAIFTRGSPTAKGVISAHRWMDLLDARFRLRRRWRALFARFDAVLAPAFGTVAFPHVDEPNAPARRCRSTARRRPTSSSSPGPASRRSPACRRPPSRSARSAEGLPIGLQVIGGFLQDRTAIAIATWLYERSTLSG